MTPEERIKELETMLAEIKAHNQDLLTAVEGSKELQEQIKNLLVQVEDAQKFNKELRNWITDLAATNDALKDENLKFMDWFITLRDISMAMQHSLTIHPPKDIPPDLMPPAAFTPAPPPVSVPTAAPPVVVEYPTLPPSLIHPVGPTPPPAPAPAATGPVTAVQQDNPLDDPQTNQQRMDQVRRSVLKTFVNLKENPYSLYPLEVRNRYQATWSWIVSDKTLKILCNEIRSNKGADLIPL